MRLAEIKWSMYEDERLAGLLLIDNEGYQGNILGAQPTESITLQKKSILNIDVFRNDDRFYSLRGFTINYRDGEPDVIGLSGSSKETVDFEEDDVLVGLTVQTTEYESGLP